jgi:hypothetical protein
MVKRIIVDKHHTLTLGALVPYDRTSRMNMPISNRFELITTNNDNHRTMRIIRGLHHTLSSLGAFVSYQQRSHSNIQVSHMISLVESNR